MLKKICIGLLLVFGLARTARATTLANNTYWVINECLKTQLGVSQADYSGSMADCLITRRGELFGRESHNNLVVANVTFLITAILLTSTAMLLTGIAGSVCCCILSWSPPPSNAPRQQPNE